MSEAELSGNNIPESIEEKEQISDLSAKNKKLESVLVEEKRQHALLKKSLKRTERELVNSNENIQSLQEKNEIL